MASPALVRGSRMVYEGNEVSVQWVGVSLATVVDKQEKSFTVPISRLKPIKAKCALIAWPADFISALVARLQATDDYVLYPACRQLEQIAQVADEFYLWSNGQTLDSKVVRVHNEDATASNHGSEWFFRFPYFADLSYPCAVRPRNKGEGRKNISKIPDLKVSASGRTLESCHRSLSAAVIRAGLRPRLKRLDKVAAPVLPS